MKTPPPTAPQHALMPCVDFERIYHLALVMERAAHLALLEAAPDEFSECDLDCLEMEDIAPLRAALRTFIGALKARNRV